MNINLTMRQRISIEGLLSQDSGKGKKQYTKFEIYKKIRVQDRDKYMIELPSGGVKIFERAVEEAPELTVDFNPPELRDLAELLNGCEVSGIQMLWWAPLTESVEAAIKDAA